MFRLHGNVDQGNETIVFDIQVVCLHSNNGLFTYPSTLMSLFALAACFPFLFFFFFFKSNLHANKASLL